MKYKALFNQIKKFAWKSIWAGDWSLISCSDWGEHYLTTLKVGNKPFLKNVIFFYRNGKSSAWVKETEINAFANRTIKSVDNRI